MDGCALASALLSPRRVKSFRGNPAPRCAPSKNERRTKMLSFDERRKVFHERRPVDPNFRRRQRRSNRIPFGPKCIGTPGMRIRAEWLAAVMVASAMPDAALAHCFVQAGQRYGVPPALLRAIAVVESAERAAAVNRLHESCTGSRDVGRSSVNTLTPPDTTLSPEGETHVCTR
jgi:hypothetical protein